MRFGFTISLRLVENKHSRKHNSIKEKIKQNFKNIEILIGGNHGYKRQNRNRQCYFK